MTEQRRGNPYWRKGGPSPNPGGRPKAAITAALRERVDPGEIAEFLLEVVRNPAGKMPERLKAAEMIYARLEGQPLSRSEIVADISTRTADPFEDMSDEELAALKQSLRAELRGDETLGIEEPDAVAELVLPAAAPSLVPSPPETGSTDRRSEP